MKFALLGGDSRSARLCRLLLEDGHRVHTYCLEKAALPPEMPAAGCLQSAVYGADWVLLPVPAEKNGKLNAPLSGQSLDMEELISALWPGQILCGGKLSAASSLAAVRTGVKVCDLMQRRDFTVGNAAITAEGAVQQLKETAENVFSQLLSNAKQADKDKADKAAKAKESEAVIINIEGPDEEEKAECPKEETPVCPKKAAFSEEAEEAAGFDEAADEAGQDE